MSTTTTMNEKPKQTNAYLVKICERSPSSGSEYWYEATCLSLEGASHYLNSLLNALALDYNYPEDWDKKDMGGVDWPSPDLFSVENLMKQLEVNKKNCGHDTPIWGPESDSQVQVPLEFFIKTTVVYS